MSEKRPERRFLPIEAASVRLQKRADGEGLPKITGYGAVFYDAGDPGTEYRPFDGLAERIMPGAFDRAIAEDDVRSFFNHDANIVLGRTSSQTLALSVDERGLKFEVDPPDTQAARDVIASLDRGDVDGSSFMFVVTDERFREEEGQDIREIHGVDLWEVGPVAFPAYEGTTSGVRSDDVAEVRSRVEAWKEKQRTGETPEEPNECAGCRRLERQVQVLHRRLQILEREQPVAAAAVDGLLAQPPR